jgi:hypothetical protein
MRVCSRCRLAFDELMPSGRCEGCEDEVGQQGKVKMNGNNELDVLKSAVQQQGQALNQIVQQLSGSQQQAADPRTQANQQFFNSPVEMSHAIAQRAAMEAGAASHETLRELAKKVVRDEDPELFDQYVTEIEAMVNQAPPQYQTNATVWRNAARNVKGSHLREILQAERDKQYEAKPNAPAVRIGDAASPSGSRPAPSGSGEAPRLDDEERSVLKRFKGLSEAKYLQGREDLLRQGDPKSPNPEDPSPWDRVITFDDKTGRNWKAPAA